MLSTLEMTNFQSHETTELKLGRFTAVVGPSSSGKSAVVRALRVLANNSRGTPYVRHGAKVAHVRGVQVNALGDPADAGIVVEVARGNGASVYELTLPGETEPERFTKCGSSVPEAVTAALDFGFDDLWLAGQFDKPFLVDETGSEVARVLGALTNVSMLYAAAREVNRRGSSVKTLLKDRAEQLGAARARVASYADVPERDASLQQLGVALGSAREMSQRLIALRSGVVRVRTAHSNVIQADRDLFSAPSLDQACSVSTDRASLLAHISAVRQAEGFVRSVVEMEVPSVDHAGDLAQKLRVLRERLASVRSRDELVNQEESAARLAADEASAAADEFSKTLAEIGRCPLCGADAQHARLSG